MLKLWLYFIYDKLSFLNIKVSFKSFLFKEIIDISLNNLIINKEKSSYI